MKKKLILLLFLSVFVKQCVWSILMPIWQFPDEQAHFAQVQNIMEQRTLELTSGNSTSKEIEISEKLLGTFRDEFGNNEFTHRPNFNLPFDSSYSKHVVQTLSQLPASSRTEMTLKEATGYPPLYYVYLSPFYMFSQRENLLTRVIILRLANIPLFLLTVYFAILSARILFRYSFHKQIVLLLLVAFHPMFSFVSAGTTSDNLYNLLCTMLLWIGVTSIEKMTVGRFSVGAMITVLLTFTKPQAKLILVTIGSSFLLVGSLFRKKSILFVFSCVSIIAVVGAAPVYNLFSGKQFLPDLPAFASLPISFSSFLAHVKWTLVHTYREVMPWYWGVFRWLSLTYPRVIHRTINWLVLAAIIGIFFVFIRPQYRKLYAKMAAFMIVINVFYFAGLMVFDYFFVLSRNYSFGIQGRYYFPLIVSQMIMLLMGFDSLLPNKIKTYTMWVLGMGMILLHWFAQWYVMDSYTTSGWGEKWFYELSLYKPQMITSWYLTVLYGLQILVMALLMWSFTKLMFRKQRLSE